MQSTRQLRPLPARLELAALRQAFESLQIKQEGLFDPVPDPDSKPGPSPLEISLSAPPVPGRYPLEATSPSSPPVSLNLTPTTPHSDPNSPSAFSETLAVLPVVLYHPPIVRPAPAPSHTRAAPLPQLPRTNMSAAPVFHMPLRGTPNAPKFDGSARELLRYFDDIKQLTDAAGLHGQDRIDAALRYVPRDDSETWEMLPETIAGDFDVFVDAIKPLYPGCERDAQYARSDLDFVVADQARKTMRSQTDLGLYYRNFLRVSLFLIKKKRLAESDRDRLFLEGFPEDMKTRISRRLEIKMPDTHPDDGYPQKDVYEAAQFLLKGLSSLQAQQTPGPLPASTSQPPSSTPYSQPARVPPSQPPNARAAPGVVVKQEYNMRSMAPGQQSCYFCGVSGHTTRYCREINAYERDGKIGRTPEGRIVLSDRSQIPNEGGALLKERVDHVLREQLVQRARAAAVDSQKDIPPHIATGLLCLSGPDVHRSGA